MKKIERQLIYILMSVGLFLPAVVSAQTDEYRDVKGFSQFDQLPVYLRDRGPGIPTSMFATFIRKGEFLVYPFFEYYLDDNIEYAPAEFSHGLDVDYRGSYRASEYLLFLGYGVFDRLAIELEAAYIDARLEKSPDDTTGMPDRIEESGLGDIQTQIDFLWKKETRTSPGLFSYFEVVYPHNKDKDLIGTTDWELKLGTGLIRGFGWGMITVRAAGEYSRAESKFELGELAVEYVKRVSAKWRVYAGVEGTQDEVELISEVQWHISDRAFIKLNNAFGITSKATDWAPEFGAVFSVLTGL